MGQLWPGMRLSISNGFATYYVDSRAGMTCRPNMSEDVGVAVARWK
jgi:hypothetical protein